MITSDCSCGIIRVDGYIIGKNLDHDCPLHGVKSDWYNSHAEREKRTKEEHKLMMLQQLARKARNNVRQND